MSHGSDNLVGTFDDSIKGIWFFATQLNYPVLCTYLVEPIRSLLHITTQMICTILLMSVVSAFATNWSEGGMWLDVAERGQCIIPSSRVTWPNFIPEISCSGHRPHYIDDVEKFSILKNGIGI